jgi:cytochrome d ubiquinol oxidase subunit II
MGYADIIGGILWLALTAYAVFAGADFGGGVWDVLASGPRAKRQRRAIAAAMGPVWEANHVWLIFMIVGLFTAFPSAFAQLGTALYVPFTLAMVGIVLRGAAFAFRAHASEAVGTLTPWDVIFGGASLISPFFLATAAAAVGGGFIDVQGGRVVSGFFAGWTTPLAVVLGLFAVSICAYLAATYLVVETEADKGLSADFRRRALGSGLVSGGLAIAALVIAALQAPVLFRSLTGGGLPLFVLALLNGPIALWAVWYSRPRTARLAVAAQVVFVLWAWAVGQRPYLVPPHVTINDAAASEPTLRAMLVVIGAGMVLLLPSLWYLFRVFKGRNPSVQAGEVLRA